jgi:hypothetical protein
MIKKEADSFLFLCTKGGPMGIRSGFKVMIGGIDVSDFCVYPLNFQFTLDDALDQAYLELRNSTVTDAYDPFTFVSVTVYPSRKETTWYISVDNCVVNQKTGLASHKILLVEETKILERVICRAKSFVKPLVRDYSFNVKTAPVRFTNEDVQRIYDADRSFYERKVIPPSRDNPYLNLNEEQNIVSVYAIDALINTGDGVSINSTCRVNQSAMGGFIGRDAQMIELFNNFGERVSYMALSGNINDPYVNIQDEGAYTLRVFGSAKYQPAGTIQLYPFAYEYSISAANPNNITPRELTVTRVITELLEIAEPIRYGETPRFTLNQADAAKYDNTPCAELNFANGASLWENLLEIGKIIQCIPRLKSNVVYFDALAGDSEMTPKQKALFQKHRCISQTSDKTGEKYASHLDSIVNGMMNLDDESQGAISDPFENGFRTVRSEISNTDMRTTVDTCVIRTVEPIEKCTKVTVWYDNQERDITPYIYEKKEYDLLYSKGAYPFAKAYALYYIQGQPNIYGLQYKEPNPVANVVMPFAIENIISLVVGQSVNLDGAAVLSLAFNVKYITSINGRVRQSKRNVDDIKTVSVMAFNQSANRLSSVNYGKRLKGEIAMMGSADVKVCFKHLPGDFGDVVDIIGKRFANTSWGDNMFVSAVTVKFWGQYILSEISLTKNFNQMGRFVSINSAVRQFEIDTNVSESFFLDEEYLIFTENEPQGEDSTFIKGTILENAVQSVLTGYTAANSGNNKVTLALSRTYKDAVTVLRKAYLPVQSLALGNSLLFNFKYEDNYSAGETLITPSNTNDYKLTQLVPYGDELYGEAKYLTATLLNHTDAHDGYILKIGDSLPLLTDYDYYSHLDKNIVAASSQWIVNKSSRDALNVTYQLHFVTDCGMIFGDQLMQANPLVGGKIAAVPTNSYGRPIINFYEKRVNEMTGQETNDSLIGQAGLHYSVYPNNNVSDKYYGGMTLDASAPDEYASWNIKDVNGRVLLAKNGRFNGFYYYTKRRLGG